MTGRSDGIMAEGIELIEIELFDNTVAFNIPVDSELLKQSMCITGNEPTHISVIDIPAKISSTNTPVLVTKIMPSV